MVNFDENAAGIWMVLKYNQLKKKQWKKLDNQAKKKLLFAMECNLVCRLEGCRIYKEIWDKLKEAFDLQSEENVMGF